MKRILLLFVLATVLGCKTLAPAPPANLPPGVQAKFYATYAIKDLDVIRDFADDASKTSPPLIDRATLLQIVNWHEDLIKAIHAVPDGWKATASAGLDALVSRLSAANAAKFKPYIDSARVLLQEMPS